MIKRRSVLAAAAALGAPYAARAQDFPRKPVTLVVSYAAGGMADILGRRVALALSKAWDQPVLIENRAGASQIVAAHHVSKAAPDGHTLLLCEEAVYTVNPHLYGKLPYSVAELTPVVDLVEAKTALFTHKGFGATTLDDYVRVAKSRPGSINYASLGAGGVVHLMMESLLRARKFDAVHVAYKSYPEAIQSLLTDQVQGMFGSIGGPPLDHLRSGTLVAIATSGKRRSPLLPAVPTFSELGVEIPRSHFVVFGPAGMPGRVVESINAAMRDSLRGDVASTLLAPNALEVLGSTPAEFARSLQQQSRQMAVLVKQVGVRLD